MNKLKPLVTEDRKEPNKEVLPQRKEPTVRESTDPERR